MGCGSLAVFVGGGKLLGYLRVACNHSLKPSEPNTAPEIVFPNSHHVNSALAQTTSDSPIATHISLDLCCPVFLPGFGQPAAGWTTVPEAAIDEEREIRIKEEEVGPAFDVFSMLGPPGEAGTSERLLNQHLRGTVASRAYARHAFGALGGRQRIRHPAICFFLRDLDRAHALSRGAGQEAVALQAPASGPPRFN